MRLETLVEHQFYIEDILPWEDTIVLLYVCTVNPLLKSLQHLLQLKHLCSTTLIFVSRTLSTLRNIFQAPKLFTIRRF